MKLPSILALAASITLASADPATSGGFNEYVISCKNKDLKGDCKNISLLGKLDTCIDLPDHSSSKYGDKGSSFQINGRMACRFFKTGASLGCVDPTIEFGTGLIGREGQRATGWYTHPGFMDWQQEFDIQSFLCTSMVDKTVDQLPKVVVAECKDNDDVDYACRGMENVPPSGRS